MSFKDINGNKISKNTYILDLKELKIFKVVKTDKWTIDLSSDENKIECCDKAGYFETFSVLVPKSKVSIINPYIRMANKAQEQ